MALVGDPERERAQAALRRHYVAGRLDDLELSERLELVLHARTRRDLRHAFARLPASWQQLDDVVLPAMQRARQTVRVALAFLVWLVASTFLLVAFVAWVAAEGADRFGLIAFPVAWLVLSLLLYRRAHGTRRRLR